MTNCKKFTLTIDCDGFDSWDDMQTEVCRILKESAISLADGAHRVRFFEEEPDRMRGEYLVTGFSSL